MGSKRDMTAFRQRDLESAKAEIAPELETLSNVISNLDSDSGGTSGERTLELLHDLAEVGRTSEVALRKVALVLADRGTKRTEIAKAAQVNRATINRWIANGQNW